MAVITIKPEVVADAAIRLLEREVVLPRLVTRDAEADFTGAKDDTINFRLPAYAIARTRGLRTGGARTRDDLYERSYPVKLETTIYKDVRLPDANLSLDVRNFGTQVLDPLMRGIVRGIEDVLVSKITGASYAKAIAFSYSSGNAWKDLVVKARDALLRANIQPDGSWVLAVGAGIETALLNTDLFVQAQQSGSTSALEDATLGRKAGFTIVSCPALAPDEAYAFHPSAYALAVRAPIVPEGAPWGRSMALNGWAIRAVQVLDPDLIEDVLAVETWVGATPILDEGYFDANGRFQLSEKRATEEKSGTVDATNNRIDSTAHGLANDDVVVFTSLPSGTGLSLGRGYYVVNAAANSFQVAATQGGSPIDIAGAGGACTFHGNAAPQLVRAVKITAS